MTGRSYEMRISFAEIATIIGAAGDDDAAVEGWINRLGFAVAEDWAGRKSISVEDASALMAEYRRTLEDFEAQRAATYKLNADVFHASALFEKVAGETMWAMRQRNEVEHGAEGVMKAWRLAQGVAIAAVQKEWPSNVVDRITIRQGPYFLEPDAAPDTRAAAPMPRPLRRSIAKAFGR